VVYVVVSSLRRMELKVQEIESHQGIEQVTILYKEKKISIYSKTFRPKTFCPNFLSEFFCPNFFVRIFLSEIFCPKTFCPKNFA
jgi:hypothetical protein